MGTTSIQAIVPEQFHDFVVGNGIPFAFILYGNQAYGMFLQGYKYLVVCNYPASAAFATSFGSNGKPYLRNVVTQRDSQVGIL